MIRELVGIDRVARERVDSARAWFEEQRAAIEAEKTALNANFTETRERQLQEFTNTAHSDRDALIKEVERNCRADSDSLERKFNAHRAEWSDALFARSLS
jgi:hypothetical protein